MSRPSRPKRPRGAPRLDPSERASATVAFRLRPSEARELDRRAALLGTGRTRHDAARAIVLAALRAREDVPPDGLFWNGFER